MGNDFGYSLNPNTHEDHLPPHPPTPTAADDDVIISHGGTMNFYLDTDPVEQARLNEFAENLD